MNRYIQSYKIKAVFLIFALLFQFNLRAADYIIISEVMYDTPLNEQIATGVAYSNGEFVEIYNAGSNVVNLTGWTLKGGGSTEIYNFPDNTLLAPNKYIIIAYQYNNSNFTLDQLFSNFITTADKQVFYQRKIVLSNSGEALKLRTPEGVTKDSLYIDGNINKTKPDRLCAPNEDNSPGHYCVSLQRKTSVFDNNANAITNNLEWESAPISFYKHTAAYVPPTNVPGVINSAISLDYNYIVTVSPLDYTEAVEIENGKIILQNEARSHINIQYFDGLGRPIQTLQKGVTPDNSDLVTYTEYDGHGREYKQWLPIKSTGNGAFTELGAFLSNQLELYGGDARPFSETKYEPSPLNRIIEQYGPGQDWKNNNKSIKTAYLTNANDILYFYVGGNNSLHKGLNYDANSLYKTETADEDGNITVEYKDKQGKVILKQSFDEGDPVSTYYIYNDLNQLCYVIPPKAVDELTADLSDENHGTPIDAARSA